MGNGEGVTVRSRKLNGILTGSEDSKVIAAALVSLCDGYGRTVGILERDADSLNTRFFGILQTVAIQVLPDEITETDSGGKRAPLEPDVAEVHFGTDEAAAPLTVADQQFRGSVVPGSLILAIECNQIIEAHAAQHGVVEVEDGVAAFHRLSIGLPALSVVVVVGFDENGSQFVQRLGCFSRIVIFGDAVPDQNRRVTEHHVAVAQDAEDCERVALTPNDPVGIVDVEVTLKRDVDHRNAISVLVEGVDVQLKVELFIDAVRIRQSASWT